MRVGPLVLLLCTLPLLGSCASLRSAESMSSLAIAADAYFQASSSGDIARAESLLSNDHLFIGPTGKVQDKISRVAWLDDNRDWLPSVTVRDIQIKQFGSTGRVTGVWVIPEGETLILERFVHVWVLDNGAWQMISHQVTEIANR